MKHCCSIIISFILLFQILDGQTDTSAALLFDPETGEPIVSVRADNPEPPLITLRKGDQTIGIQRGDWIVVLGQVDQSLPASKRYIIGPRQAPVLGSGKLTEVSDEGLLVLGDHSNIIPLVDIGTIEHGKARRHLRLALKGLKIGFYTNVLAGLLVPWEKFDLVDDCAMYFTFSGPAVGIAAAILEQSSAVTYTIDPSQWTIVAE